MIVFKTINDEIVKQEITAANFKQFKKAGWVEYVEPKQPLKEEPITELPVAAKELTNKGGRPKKITNL